MAKKSAPQIVSNIHTKSKRLTIVGVREEFKGKDLVNLREFTNEGEDMIATKSGFTIPAEQFKEFFNSLRKFGRTPGLLPKAGEDAKEFKILSIGDAMPVEDQGDEGDDDFESAKAEKKAKKSKKDKAAVKEKVKQKSGIQRRPKKNDEADDADPADAFNLKAFKKAIKVAVKNDDDISHAAEVVSMYKANRKTLKDLLPKHAVNALEKALANKKDESFLAKAMIACEKHIIEKDFTL